MNTMEEIVKGVNELYNKACDNEITKKEQIDLIIWTKAIETYSEKVVKVLNKEEDK